MTHHNTTANDVDVIILAGGKGTRLSSVVNDRPKPMALVAGRPFIEWQIMWLKSLGLRRVIICTGHKAEQIECELKSEHWGLDIVFVRETEALGTGGAIRNALPHLNAHFVLVMNGDSYCNFDFEQMLDQHIRKSADATLWLTHVEHCDRYGVVTVDYDRKITQFHEKQRNLGAGFINAGIYLLSKQMIATIPAGRKISLEQEVFPNWIGESIYAVTGGDIFIDIGTPESYAQATETLEREMLRLRNKVWQRRAQQHLIKSAEAMRQVADACTDSILMAAKILIHTFMSGGKLLLCGNGGSAADCQHVAAEFVSRLNRNFERPALPAIALTTDTSFITAYANDIDFNGVFARQVEALGKTGDVLVGISTSGNSKNVILAVEQAKKLGLKTIGLLGSNGVLTSKVDIAIVVPSNNTQHIQEVTLAVEHILCDLVEQALYGKL